MGKIFDEIDGKLRDFIEAQHCFFVASAPSGDGGHVNCSPKGTDSFRILGPTTVAYLDYVGSGVETIAHVRQNGRVVIMFCAFEGPPKIVRLHGRGEILEPGDAAFAALLAEFTPPPGVRAIVRVELSRIADSCGYAVPRLAYVGERKEMTAWAERKGEDGLVDYQREKNATSLDGLPGLRWVERE